MKKLITIILLIASGQVMGQKTVNDTLIIQYSPKIKYIKFGERVYEVVQPSLKEAEQREKFIIDSSVIFTPYNPYSQFNYIQTK